MTIAAVLFDAENVIYHRPREDYYLSDFLSQHGLTLRHRSIVDRTLRAARFDVQSGRISRDTFYAALLRVHGLEDEALFPAGRAALLLDAADIEPFPDALEALTALYEAGYLLGVVSDTMHTAQEEIDWLEAQGLPSGLWSLFAASSELGMLKLGREMFELALGQLAVGWEEAAFVGRIPEELALAHELGLLTIAFMLDDPDAEADYQVDSFTDLQNLFFSG